MTKVESERRPVGPLCADEIEVTAQMVEAGVGRLCQLLEAGTGSAYVADQVYREMEQARRRKVRP